MDEKLYSIRPLEWKHNWADGIIYTYAVTDVSWGIIYEIGTMVKIQCTSIEDGKAQAEAHWQSRLMQCLEKVD